MAEPEVRIGSLESSSRDAPQDVEMGDNAEADEALGMLESTAAGEGDGEEDTTAQELEETTPKLTFLE